MFLVFNKEKIQTYIVSVLTVAVLITIANVRKVETVQTSSQEKELPIYNVQTDEKKVAFTMNCAWNADDIDKILETLQKNNVKITFFLVGEWVDKYPEAVKKIYEAGHEIGSHSNTHPHVNNLTAEKNLEEIKLSVDKIEKITGYKIEIKLRITMKNFLKYAQEMTPNDGIYNQLVNPSKTGHIRLSRINRGRNVE